MLIRSDTDGIFHLCGEFDMAAEPAFQDLLDGADPGRQVVLDLSELEFMDSTGVHAILTLAERVAGVILRAPGPQVGKLLDLVVIERLPQIVVQRRETPTDGPGAGSRWSAATTAYRSSLARTRRLLELVRQTMTRSGLLCREVSARRERILVGRWSGRPLPASYPGSAPSVVPLRSSVRGRGVRTIT
ncbi:MAG TPA: STAS domain-containing protein [Longimicrobiales bacterium]|nr:STAS domain-containing protein [Longimicrobiales bacterium]